MTLFEWSGDEIIIFLDIYRQYEDIHDTIIENHKKKNAREQSIKSLMNELIEAGFDSFIMKRL